MKDLRSIVKPKTMKPIPSYGDMRTKEEFLSCVKVGAFIDYDGEGEFATFSQASYVVVKPSDVSPDKPNNWPVWATHVVWYNR